MRWLQFSLPSPLPVRSSLIRVLALENPRPLNVTFLPLRLRTELDVLAATDFFSVKVWTALGLVGCHLLVVIRLATREVHMTAAGHRNGNKGLALSKVCNAGRLACLKDHFCESRSAPATRPGKLPPEPIDEQQLHDEENCSQRFTEPTSSSASATTTFPLR